jgi:hypothetical protein
VSKYYTDGEERVNVVIYEKQWFKCNV